MKKNIISLAIIFMIYALFTGCAVTKPVTLTSTFDIVSAREMLEPGKNTINGSALIRQRGGGVVTCAGREVILVPATDYANERMKIIYGNTIKGYRPAPRMIGTTNIQFNNTVPEYTRLRKLKIGNPQGHFSFYNIKDGGYFVVTSILWQINDWFYEGGSLMHYVEVSGGETKEVVLSP